MLKTEFHILRSYLGFLSFSFKPIGFLCPLYEVHDLFATSLNRWSEFHTFNVLNGLEPQSIEVDLRSMA